MTTATRDRLRVLQVTPRFHPHIGGIETHVLEVSRRLQDEGLRPSVLTTVTTEAPPGRDRVERLPVHRFQAWPRSRDYCFAPGIVDAVATSGADVVHIQGIHTFVPALGMLGARRGGIPYVVTFHTGGHSSRLRTSMRKFQWHALKPLLVGADWLVGVSRFEGDYFSDLLDIPRQRFRVIPNGAELPSANGAGGLETDGPRIVSVGRLERYKGHQRAIAALTHILEQEPRARLSIIGSGPYREELLRLAKRLGVKRAVEIKAIPLERRHELAAELKAASLFVLLSDYEAHPVAVMEALYLGTPVLVTDTSGLAELADKGWARRVAMDSPPRAIAEAVLRQLQSPLVPEGVEFPTWEGCTRSLIEVYESVSRRPVCVS